MSDDETQTLRERIRQALLEGRHSVDSLARIFGISRKDVEEEVRHVERSAGRALSITPAECPGCGFVFRERGRLTAPSRCPKCRQERVDPPHFTLAEE